MDFSIEEMTMNAWPSLQTILLDGWIIRMANGYTKRANSVNPIYSFKNKLEERITYCENIFRNNNLPIIFKIVDCKEQEIIDHKLETLNYDKIDLTSVQICDELKPAKNIENIYISNKFNENWNNCFYHCYNIDNIKTIETIEKMLENIKNKKICVYKQEKGTFAGCGYGVIENGLVGLFDIIVKKDFRGKGYGREIVEAILSKAKEEGVNRAYLAVVNDNIIAKKLYAKIGFKEIYKYWYRKKD